METTHRYTINNDLVLRDNDKTLFSIEKMEIYRFNDEGFRILKSIESGNAGDVLYADLSDIQRDYIDEFITEIKSLNLIKE